MASPRDFLEELKRRQVFRIAAAYAVVAWLVVQVADTTFPALGLPDTALTFVIVAAVLGFPVALVLAWAFERTGGALRRAEGAPAVLHRTAVWSLAGLVVAASLAAGAFLVRSGAVAGAGGAQRTPIGGASLAVLPFTDLSPNQDQAYFADGLAEELLNVLAQVEGLRVAARLSSFALRGPGAPPVTEIGQRLGVATVLQGGVRASGDSVRVTVQLVDTRDGMQVWSDVYQRGLDDIFAIQDEISHAIANALELRLIGNDASARRSRPRDAEAYQAYLRGRYAWNQRTAEGLHESIKHFQRAVDLEPGFALGYAGLADAYMLLEDFGELSREEAFGRGTAAARRALQIDETLAEAHTSLAHILMHQREYEASRSEYEKAIALNPNLATAHQWYALLLVLTEQWDEADVHAAHAVALDPLSLAAARTHALVAFMGRRPAEAVARFEAAARKYADNDGLLDWMINVYALAGRHADAVRVAERLAAAFPDGRYYRTKLAHAYAAAGRADDARRVLAVMEPDGPAPQFALAYAHLGDLDRAFHWLDRAADARDPYLDFLRVDPTWDVLRDDPRFADLLRKTGHSP